MVIIIIIIIIIIEFNLIEFQILIKANILKVSLKNSTVLICAEITWN